MQVECTLLLNRGKLTKENVNQKVKKEIEDKLPTLIKKTNLINELTGEFYNRFVTENGDFASLMDNTDHEDWFQKDIVENKPFWSVYKKYLQKSGNFSPQSLDDLDKTTDSILSSIENPLREGTWDRRGMVIGSVQSGKTANIIGLINKARDSGYKFIVILSGSNNDLRQQTQERVDEGYTGLKTFHLMDDSKVTNSLGALRVNNFNDNFQPPISGTVNDINGDFNKDSIKKIPTLNIQKDDETSFVFVVKKNKTPLERLIQWITTHPQCKNGASGFEKKLNTNTTQTPFMERFPILVVDDECDHSTVDTGDIPRDEKGNFIEEYDPKTINGLIRKLLMCFSRRCYVGYTATPFANIFQHDERYAENYGEDLFPKSFMFDIQSPSNHLGLSALFGKSENDEDVETVSQSNFLVEVNDFCEEPNNINCSKGWIPPKHGSGHNPVYDSSKHPVDHNLDEKTLSFYLKIEEIFFKKKNKNLDLSPSMIHSVMSFIISSAVRNVRSYQQIFQHKSMLIHVSKFIDVQKKIEVELIDLIEIIKEIVEEDDSKEFFYESLKFIYENYFYQYTKEVVNKETNTITFEELKHHEKGFQFLIGEISRNIYRMSGRGGQKPEYEKYKKQYGHGLTTIVIGGDKLSRGVTFEGLSTTYFLRCSKMYDTLMQMGRWFGYRDGYEDLCRLYTSNDLLESFVQINIASEQLRARIRVMQKLNKTPKEFGLYVHTSPGMLITSKLKMKDSYEGNVNFSLHGTQMVTSKWEKEEVLKNFDLTDNFIKSLGVENENGIKKDLGTKYNPKNKKRENVQININPGYLWKNTKSEKIINFLESFNEHQDSNFRCELMSNFIQKANKRNQLIQWDVALIANGASGREIEIGDKKINLAYRMPRKTTDVTKICHQVIWDPTHEYMDISKEDFQDVCGQIKQTASLIDQMSFSYELRRKRSEQKGLLLIYPILPIDDKLLHDIYPNEKNAWKIFKKNFKPNNVNEKIKSRKAIFSLCISFPKTDDDIITPFRANNVYFRQETGLDL